MTSVTFITGNQGKADFLAKYLGLEIAHQKVDVKEMQSLDLEEIAEHKVRQAYAIIGSPVLVEDVGLSIKSLGNLPGPFIKWFELELGLEGICKLVDKLSSREAIGSITYCYFDGSKPRFFNGKIEGSIADRPKGANNFGWDPIFIPTGAKHTL
ncbi:hypothetical protein BVY00_02370, partial [bacterium G20]